MLKSKESEKYISDAMPKNGKKRMSSVEIVRYLRRKAAREGRYDDIFKHKKAS